MNILKGFKSVLGSMLVWSFVISVLSIAFLGMITYESFKTPVQVTKDGKSQLIRTHSNTVGDLLSELDVTVQPHDEVSHKLSAPIQYGMDVDYKASKSLNLIIDDNTIKQYHTTASTVEDFFNEQELSFKERDEVSHTLDDSIVNGMDIQVNQAIQVTVNDGGEKNKVWTVASTVDELLKKQGVKLNKLDDLEPAKTAALTEDTPVTITRIEKVTDIIEEPVEYAVETRNDASMPKGNKRVVTSGEKGLVTKEYEVILKNGEEASRELVDEKVEKESKDQIVALGTKVEAPEPEPEPEPQPSTNSSSSSASSSSDAPSMTVSRGKTSGSRTLYMHATAYTANCSGCSGITATGINLKENSGRKVVAVDPDVIPLGSRVWVEGYGYAIAGDTGGAINGNRIDLFVSSQSQALSYGRRNVQVKILD